MKRLICVWNFCMRSNRNWLKRSKNNMVCFLTINRKMWASIFILLIYSWHNATIYNNYSWDQTIIRIIYCQHTYCYYLLHIISPYYFFYFFNLLYRFYEVWTNQWFNKHNYVKIYYTEFYLCIDFTMLKLSICHTSI